MAFNKHKFVQQQNSELFNHWNFDQIVHKAAHFFDKFRVELSLKYISTSSEYQKEKEEGRRLRKIIALSNCSSSYT